MGKSAGERMAVIETEINTIKKTSDDHHKLLKRIDEKIDKLNEKFAGKWVEKAVIGVSVAILSGVIIVLLNKGFGG